jgi:hypothetical protein
VCRKIFSDKFIPEMQVMLTIAHDVKYKSFQQRPFGISRIRETNQNRLLEVGYSA